MIEALYQQLAALGYTHPLHPAVTHLPVGLVMAAFIFTLLSFLFRRPGLQQSARHCLTLALVSLPVVALLGYLDWQQRWSGADLAPVRIKMMLAGILFVLLLGAVIMGGATHRPDKKGLLMSLLCLGCVIGLGFYGGELVYGTTKTAPPPPAAAPAVGTADPIVAKGQAVFEQKCSFCHFSDQTAAKVGPGLKGLFARPKMKVSGWPTSEDNIRKQLKTPFQTMPPVTDLTEEQVKALMTYLKTL